MTAKSDRHAPARGWLFQNWTDADGVHIHGLFVPRTGPPPGGWPLLVFLHGAGERGRDGVAPTEVGLGPAIERQESSFPFVVVFPQCEAEDVTPPRWCWLAETADSRRALAIVDHIVASLTIDADRVSLAGMSMGGFGVWSWAAADPSRWAALVPICGGGEPANAGILKDVPVWAFHGDLDDVVLPDHSRDMVAALQAVGGSPRYTEFERCNHNSWDPAFATAELFPWLASQRRPQSA